MYVRYYSLYTAGMCNVYMIWYMMYVRYYSLHTAGMCIWYGYMMYVRYYSLHTAGMFIWYGYMMYVRYYSLPTAGMCIWYGIWCTYVRYYSLHNADMCYDKVYIYNKYVINNKMHDIISLKHQWTEPQLWVIIASWTWAKIRPSSWIIGVKNSRGGGATAGGWGTSQTIWEKLQEIVWETDYNVIYVHLFSDQWN